MVTTMEDKKFVSQPLYVQLREVLMQRISSGVWQPGAALPNEIDLAREFGLSAGTVRKALDWMEQANLVVRQQGRGTFVRDPSGDDLAGRYENLRAANGAPIDASLSQLSTEQGEASARECVHLQIGPGSHVRRIRQLRSIGNMPFMVEETSVPVELFPEHQPAEYNLAKAAKECGVLLGKAIERIQIDRAQPAIAEVLGLTPGAPVLRLDRLVHVIDGRPAEWRVAYCNLGDNQYVATLGNA